MFNVYLGSATPFATANLQFNQRLYLGVTINNGTELPRTQLAKVPFAFHADNAATASLATTVVDGAITVTKLADGAVTAPKIAIGAVTTDKIAAGAISSSNLADGSITLNKISNAGAANGQTIINNNGKLEWGNPAGGTNDGDITAVTAG
ncbi:MAG: hypothetical protein DYG96_16500, partial [Chlorobi bacterium CHB2]|nr:hypothetical protein [Chlorobi bacterium CHB2]